ncbi:MAG: hypothetical protein AB1489_31200 [Acidobacteriota bacterium]
MVSGSKQPNFRGIELALKQWCVVKCLPSSMGLRIVRIEKADTSELLSYSERASIELALADANEDFLAGDIDPNSKANNINFADLAEARKPTSLLDLWVMVGNRLRCFRSGREIKCTASGVRKVKVPEYILEKAKLTDKPLLWDRDVYTFQTIYQHYQVEDGDSKWQTEVIQTPLGVPETKAWLELIRLEETGRTFIEVLRKINTAIGKLAT